MGDFFYQDEFKTVRFASISARKLAPSVLSPELRNLLGCRTSALREPGDLTPLAIQTATLSMPPLVVRRGPKYRVVGNFRSAELAEHLPEGARIGVLVLPGDFPLLEEMPQFSTLLSTAVEGLALRYATQEYLRLWQRVPAETRAKISPDFRHRSGLARMLGIRRQERISAPQPPKSRFRQMGMFEDEESLQ